MLQRFRRALEGKTGQDWLESSILGIATALVLLAAAGTLGHRMSEQFAAVEAAPGAAPGGKAAPQGGQSAGTSDPGAVVGPVRPAAADGAKAGDEEDGFD